MGKTKYLDSGASDNPRVRFKEGAGEYQVESWLLKKLTALDCLYWKFVSPGTSGVPDRIVVLPTGDVFFVELKRDSGVISAIQMYRRDQIIAHNARHRFVRGMSGAEEFVKEVEDVIRSKGIPVPRN